MEPFKVCDWGIEDVSTFLKINNLEKIVDNFRNNGIKGNSLLKIKKEDFEELGILDMLTIKEGDKILDLIENLKKKEMNQSFFFNIKDYYFDYKNEIGSGSFGKVYKVTHNSDSTVIRAVKKIMKSKKKKDMDRIEVEKNILKSMDHPNIIKIYGYSEDKDFVYILMEYIPNSIKDLYTKKQFSLDEIRKATMSILEGLEYIHKNGYIHRDLKSKNILINEKFQAKIIDFGLSYMIEDINGSNFDTMVGTHEFLAPELFFQNSKEYGRSCDIWSLGCVVLEMYLRGNHWNGENPFEKNPYPLIPIELPNNLKDFLTCCFHISPLFRPTAKQLLSHPWILGNQEIIKIIPMEDILLSEYLRYGAHYYFQGVEMCLNEYSYDFYIKFRGIENFKETIKIEGNEELAEKFLLLIENISYLKVGHFILVLTKEIKSQMHPLNYVFLKFMKDVMDPRLDFKQKFMLKTLDLLEFYSYHLVYKYHDHFTKTNSFHKNRDKVDTINDLARNFDLVIGKSIFYYPPPSEN